MDVDRAAHFGGTREGGRAGQAGVEDRDADGAVGLQLVVVVGEGERRARLEAVAISRRPRQPFGELGDAAACVVLPVSSSGGVTDARNPPARCRPMRRSQT